MSSLNNPRTNTFILVKKNTPNIPRVGQIEFIILVPAHIIAPNFEFILNKPVK